MSLCRVNAANHKRGLRSAESGLDLESFRQITTDPKEYIRDSNGSRTGFFHCFDATQRVAITGNIITDMDAVMGVAFGTSLTIANAYDGYGVTAGAWYLEDIETNEAKGQIATASLNAERTPTLLAPS